MRLSQSLYYFFVKLQLKYRVKMKMFTFGGMYYNISSTIWDKKKIKTAYNRYFYIEVCGVFEKNLQSFDLEIKHKLGIFQMYHPVCFFLKFMLLLFWIYWFLIHEILIINFFISFHVDWQCISFRFAILWNLKKNLFCSIFCSSVIWN